MQRVSSSKKQEKLLIKSDRTSAMELKRPNKRHKAQRNQSNNNWDTQLTRQSKRAPTYLFKENNYLKITLTTSVMKNGV